LVAPIFFCISKKDFSFDPLLPQIELVGSLAAFLYSHLYIRPPEGLDITVNDSLTLNNFRAELIRANRGRGTWEFGWLVEHLAEDGTIVVTNRGIRFWATRSEVRPEQPGITPGAECSVFVPSNYMRLLPGFHLIYGNADRRVSELRRDVITRMYWNLTERAAPKFIATVTHLFNEAAIPFHAKIANAPSAYKRADAGIIYLDKSHFEKVRSCLVQTYTLIEDMLRDEVPLFTKLIAPGLSVAEDPADGLSFGKSRCALVAQVLLRIANGQISVDAFENAIDQEFQARGLDAEKPFLSANSIDIYTPGEFPAQGSVRSAIIQTERNKAQSTGIPAPPLELVEATAIAKRIGYLFCSHEQLNNNENP
jgi:hypothetical protein